MGVKTQLSHELSGPSAGESAGNDISKRRSENRQIAENVPLMGPSHAQIVAVETSFSIPGPAYSQRQSASRSTAAPLWDAL